MSEFHPKRDSTLMLKEMLSELRPNGEKDIVTWRWGRFDKFSVKSLHDFLRDGGVKDTSFAQLWSIRAPLQVKSLFG